MPVLDARPLGQDPAAVAQFVTEHAGPHRLVTDQPIGLVDDAWEPAPSGGASYSAHYKAAARGCDLVVVLDAQMMALPGYGGKPQRTLIVHLGVLEGDAGKPR